MRNLLVLFIGLFTGYHCLAQKKTLDQSVYDHWQSLGEKLVSADGKYIAFVINLQEGDGELVVRSSDGSFEKHFPRGYQPAITADSRFLVALIKPLFKETREARIKKLPLGEMPKDSLLVLDLEKDSLQKMSDIKSYKITGHGAPWMAVHLHKKPADRPTGQSDSLSRIKRLETMADSLGKIADSFRRQASNARVFGLQTLNVTTAIKKEAKTIDDLPEEGTDLMVMNLATGSSFRNALVSEFLFNKNGNVLVMETTRKKGNEKIVASILWHDLKLKLADTVMKVFQDAKNYAITEDGTKLAFVAERDSLPKAIRKLYKAWWFTPGMDSAKICAGPVAAGKQDGYIIQPEYNNYFSKDGSKLFIGLSGIPLLKDTNLVDFETARLDLWNYQDDYLQPQQLVQLNNTLRKSWLAVIELPGGHLVQLGNDTCETVIPSQEGDGRFALGISTSGFRIQQQWTQHQVANLYLIDLKTGQRRVVARKIRAGSAGISPAGKFIYWYNNSAKQWICYEIRNATTKVLSAKIPYPLFDEEDDHPDDPPAYGMMGWLKNDQLAYVYDRYDIWSCDPTGQLAPVQLTGGAGRENRIEIRYEKTDPEEKFISNRQEILLKLFDEKSKGEGWFVHSIGLPFPASAPLRTSIAMARFDNPVKARDADIVLYRQQQPSTQNLFLSSFSKAAAFNKAIAVSQLNPQQASYNWYSVELRHWKMGNGKMGEGLLYKPENFDSTKKYPVIFYFYERNADNRFNYIEPMPVRSSINIAYYTSNGYLVFDPNIYYKTGQPGEDAYNSVVSAAKYLAGFKWVDKAHMGLQGHSWGGYQVAYLVTRTNIFVAAEAGAPVSNMTSAYGGIRWGTGISRQFQYEKTQSRLGATLWERPELYIKNSPLFRADKIQTPLLILHNDKDDAVPWYQGIELFTALRRLGKPVWMASYNDELHGIMERRNRKDWTIRMAQFFDHYLKGKPEPKWMKEGIPAIHKGISWGLDY